jgi:hypothetical protein
MVRMAEDAKRRILGLLDEVVHWRLNVMIRGQLPRPGESDPLPLIGVLATVRRAQAAVQGIARMIPDNPDAANLERGLRADLKVIHELLPREWTPLCYLEAEALKSDWAAGWQAAYDESTQRFDAASSRVNHTRHLLDREVRWVARKVGGSVDDHNADAPPARDEKGASARGGEYRPGRWFGKSMTAKLRKAAGKTRVGMKVRKRTIDGVVCYNVADARRWWGKEVPE